MLQRFWSYLFFLRRLFPAETAHRLDDCRKSVELAPPVLQAISTLTIPDANEDILAQVGGNQKRKRGKRAAVAVNTEPFRKFGVDVPSTSLATEQLATSILQDQKRILEVTGFTNSYFLRLTSFAVLPVDSSPSESFTHF
jgi:hypothetical protein